MPFSFMRSPSPLEKMESKILKEGKIEDTTVKHDLKDLATLEKESQKARKALEKAQHTLAKREKEEHSATAALNKATHSHEVAVVKLDDAAKDLKLRQERETKLHADLAEKRAELDKVVAIQKAHNEDREARISEIREEREQKSGSVRSAASPIISSPATSSIAPPVSAVEPQTSGSAPDAPPVAKADTESITAPTVASSTVVGASSTAA